MEKPGNRWVGKIGLTYFFELLYLADIQPGFLINIEVVHGF
jgi:hypothetical protein